MNKIAFGRKLFYARKMKNITTNQLAEKLGLSGSYLRQLECGNRKPSIDLLITLCNTLEISPDFLLTEDLSEECSTRLKQLDVKLSGLFDRELRMCEHFVDAVRSETELKK